MTRGPTILACMIFLAMLAVAVLMGGCAVLDDLTAPPPARELCAAPPTSRLWDHACEGMYKPRRPPENLCSDPDGRDLWPNDYAIRCKEK